VKSISYKKELPMVETRICSAQRFYEDVPHEGATQNET